MRRKRSANAAGLVLAADAGKQWIRHTDRATAASGDLQPAESATQAVDHVALALRATNSEYEDFVAFSRPFRELVHRAAAGAVSQLGVRDASRVHA